MTIRWNLALMALSLAFFIGCADTENAYQEVSTADADAAQEAAEHDDHAHEAPHGGHLVELGDHEYNVEFVFEAKPEAKLVAYILDAHAEAAVSVAAKDFIFHLEGDDDEHEIILTADPQDGDKEGETTRFSATGDALPKGIKDIEDVAGHLHLAVGDKEYAGDLEHSHGHHEHGKHGDHDDHKEHKNGDKDHDEHHKDGDKDGHEDHKDGDKEHKDGDKEHKKDEKDAPAANADKDTPVETKDDAKKSE